MAVMLTGRLLAESLRVGADLEVADLRVVRIGRHDVSNSTTPSDGFDLADDSPAGRRLANHGSGPSLTSKLPRIEPTIWHKHWPRHWRARLVGGPTLLSEVIMWCFRWTCLPLPHRRHTRSGRCGRLGAGLRHSGASAGLGCLKAAVDDQEIGAAAA
jgi:hypothetical protein